MDISDLEAFFGASQTVDELVSRAALTFMIDLAEIETLLIKYYEVIKEAMNFSTEELRELSRVCIIRNSPQQLMTALLIFGIAKATYKEKDLSKEVLFSPSLLKQVEKEARMNKLMFKVANSDGDKMSTEWDVDKLKDVQMLMFFQVFNVMASGSDAWYSSQGNSPLKLSTRRAADEEVVNILKMFIPYALTKLELISQKDAINNINEIKAELEKSVRNNSKLKEKVEDLSTKLTQLEKENQQLKAKHKETDKPLDWISLTNDLKKMQDANIKLNNDIQELLKTKEQLSADLAETAKYKQLYEVLNSVAEEDSSSRIDVEIDISLLQSTRIIVIGGYEIWQSNLEKWCAANMITCKCVTTNTDRIDLPQLNSKDLVIFNLRNITHPAMWFVMDEIRNRNAIVHRTLLSDTEQIMKGAYNTYLNRWKSML